MRTLTPVLPLPAPEQVSLIHEHALPDIPSPTTPCASVCRPCFLLRADLAPDSLCVAIGGSSDFAQYSQSRQSHQAVSSLYRNPRLGRSSTDYPFTSSCSPPRVATTQLLSVTGGKLRQRGTLTPLCTLTFKRTSAAVPCRFRSYIHTPPPCPIAVAMIPSSVHSSTERMPATVPRHITAIRSQIPSNSGRYELTKMIALP